MPDVFGSTLSEKVLLINTVHYAPKSTTFHTLGECFIRVLYYKGDCCIKEYQSIKACLFHQVLLQFKFSTEFSI